MNIVFLDFDGVWRGTNTALAFGGVVDTQSVTLITKLLEAANTLSATKLVITSTHRVGVSRQDMEKFLCDSGASEFCKYLHDDWKTPVGSEHPFGRLKEINEWLDGREGVNHYVIIDDDWDDTTDETVESKNRLVHVDSKNGFSFRDLSKSLYILNITVAKTDAEDFINHGSKF